MADLPVLGLLVEGLADPAVTPLLVELRRWCRPAMYADGVAGVAAWLAMSPEATVPDDRPLAVWMRDEVELGRYPDDVMQRVRVVLCPPGVEPAVQAPVVEVPLDSGGAVGSTAMLTPFVRRRWRRRFALPEELTVVLSDDVDTTANGVPIPAGAVTTALMLASVVVAPREPPLEALATGAPCVADVASAGHVIADDVEAARLGLQGRRGVERWHSARHAARRVARLLGLDGPADPLERIALRLDELETPAASRVRDRVADAVSALVAT